MADLNIEGMALASDVAETIIAIAAKEVQGVAAVGASPGLLASLSGKRNHQGIEVVALDDGRLAVEIHIEATYGSVLPDVADAVRSAVADAVALQVGAQVAAVDVFIDGIQF